MRFAFLLIVCIGTVLLAGCGLREQPFTYGDRKEMSDQPGLFTGQTGTIIIYREQGPPLLKRQ
jgi:hypothetical protein